MWAIGILVAVVDPGVGGDKDARGALGFDEALRRAEQGIARLAALRIRITLDLMYGLPFQTADDAPREGAKKVGPAPDDAKADKEAQ